MVDWRQAIIGIVILCIVVIAAVILMAQKPAEVLQPFNPDGSHMGDFQWQGVWYSIAQIILGPTVPGELLTTNLILQWIIFPLIAMWVVFFGIFTELRIFRKHMTVNYVLPFMIVLVAGPTGWFIGVVRTVFITIGTYGFAVFGILMLFGITMWGLARGTEFSAGFEIVRRVKDEIESLNEQHRILEEKRLDAVKRGKDTKDIDAKMAEIEVKISNYEKKYGFGR